MRIVPRLLLIGLLTAAATACGKHDSAAGSGAVLATVNGKPITSEMVAVFVRANSGGRDIQLNDEQRRQVVNNLVDFELLAQEARKNGVADQPDFKAELAVYENNQLARLYMKQYLDSHQVTDAQLQAAFQARVKAGKVTPVYKARHILVDDEALARKIIAQLGKGADFGKLAQQYSKDKNSAVNGGELGDWISPDGLVPEFSKAMVALKKGEYTKQPVHSQYGWHVIQLEDVQQPSLEQLRPQLADELQNKSVEDFMNKLRGSAQVKINDVTPAPAKASAAAPAKP
jgi:peptidyl-prolyl cis-trans isomerase C